MLKHAQLSHRYNIFQFLSCTLAILLLKGTNDVFQVPKNNPAGMSKFQELAKRVRDGKDQPIHSQAAQLCSVHPICLPFFLIEIGSIALQWLFWCCWKVTWKRKKWKSKKSCPSWKKSCPAQSITRYWSGWRILVSLDNKLEKMGCDNIDAVSNGILACKMIAVCKALEELIF